MPVKSKRQKRAMGAAAGGNSTLGIPQSVGKEMLAATPPGAKLPEKAPKKKKKGKDFSFTK
jgi:hypothetical protein